MVEPTSNTPTPTVLSRLDSIILETQRMMDVARDLEKNYAEAVDRAERAELREAELRKELDEWQAHYKVHPLNVRQEIARRRVRNDVILVVFTAVVVVTATWISLSQY